MNKEKNSIDAVKLERTRSHFRSLVTVNPNYFGNLPKSGFKAVKKIASNTSFEELSSVGYNPRTRRLFATFDIKKANGYGGDLCDDGSTEYVRFFADFGSGWQDVGVVATDVHDIPLGKDCAKKSQHPLTYSLELPFAPRRKWCTKPQLPRVRAILSWNAEPPAGNPNFSPVYGNVKECAVQIAKAWKFNDFMFELPDLVKPDLFKSLKPVLPKVVPQIDPEFPEIPGLPELPYPGPSPIEDLPELNISELFDIYSKSTRGGIELTVEPHRFAFKSIEGLQKNLKVATSDASQLTNIFEKAKLSVADLVAKIEDTTGNISYEELVDVGLDHNREILTATYHIKRQSGFSGGLCTNGSNEHVAFWVDWNDTCEWEYLDIVSLKAYDFNRLPDGGLCYTASLPVDLAEFKRKCTNPKVARVRAVLSWSTQPSQVDPNAVPTWGNRLDAHVLVPRLEGAPGKINLVGGISTEFISNLGYASPTAKFADTGISVATSNNEECPFGGLIVVRGPAVNGKRYRLRVEDADGDSQTLTEKVWVTPTSSPSHYHSGDADGWFSYLTNSQNSTNKLGYYRSSGNGLVTIILEIEGLGEVDSQAVQLDNIRPEVSIEITDPAGDCSVFQVGTTIKGNVIATDVHMRTWSVVADGGPAGFSPGSVPVGIEAGCSTTVNTPVSGCEWTLDTTGMSPCGYIMRVTAHDRTIVNSGGGNYRSSVDVGFCLQ